MIQVENLSYAFPAKDLYKDVSFTLKMGQHCAFIGSNGAGKSTLVDMIIHPDKYLYDGRIIKHESCRIGYASQFAVRDKAQECTVFEYLSERFVENQKATVAVCEEMAVAEDVEPLIERYQSLLDAFEAMDGDHYENNIRKQLYVAGMRESEETKLSQLSGGEYKLIQIMREMLLAQNLLVLDEPDVFLDFSNLNRLCQLINGYKGTLLVITHNRYLLNHCFDKILHLENGDLQEYEGNYTEYRCSQLREKLKLKLQSIEEQEEIERTEKMVDILRTRASLLANPVIGSAVNAKQTQLDRLRARQIKAPFIELREPKIELQAVEVETKHTVLSITNYNVSFDESLLENINFELRAGEKIAIVGANGTGKTILMRDILKNNHPSIHINENTSYACLSQLQGENFDETKTVYEVMENLGFKSSDRIREYLGNYCLEGDTLKQKVSQLSGGEKNLLQIAMIANTKAELLILDEPTSHLDIYAQMAMEKAIFEYKGAVLMVSHDFYLVANCADYVLLVDDNTIRRMRTRSFRKMVYDKYFDHKYLEIDKKKQELETKITLAFKKNELTNVEKLCSQLEALSAN
ncbi:ABC-F family ATP-binding cassette domain-containing protein [Acidaminobacter sp.]|uniref:ABC-F family ATP-binding cassette domain-containing protein n=1 Tax=Acidaminobacter sp. TaxID=1872102 RepID=UPI00137D6127|nr:ATP-binding cassette domain-containing protein [Acidaminobacter sp.]MDK9710521.1 ATP-binding cassette domain-containing protein [Acidaminobacter sp.]MZQ97871.1 ATP-binding cassette domain-containing protein [Acidaminobacter sp.]